MDSTRSDILALKCVCNSYQTALHVRLAHLLLRCPLLRMNRYMAQIVRHHCDVQINAGGSLANTLANMGRLSTASEMDLSGRAAPLRVAAASIVGGDALGSFHSAQQQNAGVTTLSHPVPDSCTGKLLSGL